MRLAPANAATLFALVQGQGMSQTTVVVSAGAARGGEEMARRRVPTRQVERSQRKPRRPVMIISRRRRLLAISCRRDPLTIRSGAILGNAALRVAARAKRKDAVACAVPVTLRPLGGRSKRRSLLCYTGGPTIFAADRLRTHFAL